MSYNFNKVKNLKTSRIIFKLNNDPIARRYSKNPKQFSYKVHKNWLRDILKCNSEKIYVVKFKNKSIGILREKKRKIRYNLSWVISKNYRNLGHGKNLLKKYTSEKKKFSAFIHIKNISSIKIAYFAGFKIKKRDENFIEFYKN